MTEAIAHIVGVSHSVTMLPVEVADFRTFGFNAYCHLQGITWDRPFFGDWLPRLIRARCWSLLVWECYYALWQQSQAYCDLLAADRYDDGADLRRDPHMDACIG